jgi:hypothetical protein
VDFEAFGSEIQRDARFDAAAIQRWRRFVAGEGLSTSPPTAPAAAS